MTSSDSRSALPHFVGCSAYRVRRSQSTSSVGLPSGLTAGAETGLSCSHDDCPTIPRPLRRRVLRGCISKRFTPSMAFAHSTQARLPVGPLRGLLSTRQASLYAADWWVAPSLKKARPHASTPGSLRTPVGCYRGTWLLLRPDFHRLVVVNLRTHVEWETGAVAALVRRCPRTSLQALRSRDRGSVSSLPSSNRACGSPAPGFPRSFTGSLSALPCA